MSTSLFSLIFAGIFGVGTFAGTIQQNLFHPSKPEIDLLFKEIEKLIRNFSKENPIDGEKLKEIKCAASKKEESNNSCKKEIKESKNQDKNTLEVWTTIWVSLINNYVDFLWKKYKQKFKETISDENKKNAIKFAESNVEDEKKVFKEKLSKKQSIIDVIYEKMKEFVLKIEFPENYQYEGNNYYRGPYENYVEEILKSSK